MAGIVLARPAVFSAVDLSAARPGVKNAIEVAVDRVAGGESTTALCLPTRYGKSDVIRVAPFVCKHAGYSPVGVVLSPNVLLSKQVIDEKRVRETLGRYKITGAYRVGRVTTLENPWANDEVLLSATMQFVQRHVDIFASHWVPHVIARTGLPPTFYIDEAHLTSVSNAWGECIQRLIAAGARLVLLTATPYRTKAERIPGFEYDVIDSQRFQEYIHREGDDGETWVDVYESSKDLVRLRAHHYTTFREAWDEVPSPLCKVGPVRYNIDLTELGVASEGVSLKTLGLTDARRLLRSVVRHPSALRATAVGVIEQLQIFREWLPEVGAIVFTGNDDDPATEANKHAREFTVYLERHADSLGVPVDPVIATSADVDADNEDTGVRRIIDFTEHGRGNVLVVKQMAGMGLDSARIKIGADLSDWRAPAPYIQRLMRVATPLGPTHHAVWISPDEANARKVWNKCIRDQGGESHVTRGELVDSYRPPQGPTPPPGPQYLIGDARPSDFEDSHFHRASADMYPAVKSLVEEWPQIIQGNSYAEVAERLVARGLSLSIDQNSPQAASPQVVDTTKENEELYEDIDPLVRDIAKMRMKGKEWDPELWRAFVKDIYNAAKRNCGISLKVELREITNTDDLRRLKANVQAIRDAEVERLQRHEP